jgi:predicted secreted protein
MSMHTTRRALTVTALTTAAMTLVGCSSSNKSSATKPSSASNSSMKSPEQRAIVATPRQSRDVATAVKGQTFTVQLPTSNGSGYAWRLAPASADDNYVSLQELKQQQTSSDIPGAPASDVFTFRANRMGQTTLTFIYDRPWNNDAPPRTFTLDVDVYKNARELAQANAESSMPE